MKNLQVKLQQVHQLARTNLKKTANYRKKHYDIKSSKRVLASGQAVWLYEPSKRPGVCAKLTPKWKGPALVLQKLDDLTYLVKMKSNTPAKIYHIDRLRAYQGNSPPKWFAKALKKHRNYLVICYSPYMPNFRSSKKKKKICEIKMKSVSSICELNL